MPKTKKRFPISDTHSNGSYLVILDYYYNNISQCQLIDSPVSDDMAIKLENEGYSNDVVTSSFEAFTSEILKSINTENVVRLEALLKLEFVYDCNDKVLDDGGEITQLRSHFKFATVRPVLEALFHDQIDSFIEIILALINKNSKDLFQKFMHAIELTELDDKTLYIWNDTIKKTTLKLLNDLLKHAEKLGQKNANDLSIEKGSKLYELADTLVQNVEKHEAVQNETLKGSFETLLYKLTLKRNMHQQDDLLAQHHGTFQVGIQSLKRIGTRDSHNFVSLAKHNDSFFTPKTKSQKMVAKVEAALFGGCKKRR